MKNKYIFIILIGLCVILLCALLIKNFVMKNNNDEPKYDNPISTNTNNDFDFKIIKEANSKYNKQNYMISPLSIAYALSMVKEGADGETLKQVSSILGDYKTIGNMDVKNRIGIANLVFISNKYKKDVSKEYIKTLQTKHDSEVLFDDFKTPDAVNKWVSKKTFDMIKDPLDSINPDFVLGLANAIAIDVEWQEKFDCGNTQSKEFTKEDKTKMNAAMMSSSNDIAYIENKNAKGIIKDYIEYDKDTGDIADYDSKNKVALEYIAILPNTTIDEYMKIFDKKELDSLLSNKREHSNDLDIYLKLPKYTYDFDYNKFQESLMSMGMTDAFNPDKANFKNIIDSSSDIKVFISKAIHKSHIELSENGTKAAAVTIFTFETSGFAPREKEPEKIYINFDKPFIYIIKEKNSDNIWFFGTVYEPMKWEDNDPKLCDIQ